MNYEDVSGPGDVPPLRGEGPAPEGREPVEEHTGPTAPPDASESIRFLAWTLSTLVFALTTFILIVTWLVRALNVVFGAPTGSFIVAALFLLAAVWAGVRAKQVMDRAGGLPALIGGAGATARAYTEPARRRYGPT